MPTNGTDGLALQIHFIDPKELFGAEAFDAALGRGDISAIVAAQIGMGALRSVRSPRGRDAARRPPGPRHTS